MYLNSSKGLRACDCPIAWNWGTVRGRHYKRSRLELNLKYYFFGLGTDNANIILSSWNDLCQTVCTDSSPESCKLGLQQARESLQLLASHYLELRSASEQTLYSLLSKEYVPLIGKFIELLCIAVVTKLKKAIAEDTSKPTEGEVKWCVSNIGG